MQDNDVQDLVGPPDNCSQLVVMGIQKQRNLRGNVEPFKAKLVAKGSTQR